MKYEKADNFLKVITHAVAYLVIFGFFLWVFARIFYQDQVTKLANDLTSNFPILSYSLGFLVTGVVLIFHIRDIRRGEEKGTYSIYQMVLFFAGFVYCVFKLISSIVNKL